MLTECPNCQTRYELADSLFRRRGRRIKCASCEESWYQLPPDSCKALEVVPVKITAPLSKSNAACPPLISTPASSRVRPPHPEKPTDGWKRQLPLRQAIGVAACMALVMVAIGQRDRIVRSIPKTGAVYAAMGLPVNLRGLEFRDIKSSILSDNGQRMLAVEGVIAQVGRKNAAVPDVRVAVRDPSGRELYSWTTPAPKQKLAAGETAYFRARLAAPPVAGAQIRVQFAEAKAR